MQWERDHTMGIKIARCLNMPISTVKAIIKKFKTHAVMNMPRKTHQCIFPIFLLEFLCQSPGNFIRIHSSMDSIKNKK